MTAHPPRLLLVVNEPGNFLTHRLTLANGARAAGYEVEVATPAGARLEEIRALGFRTHTFPLSRGGMSPLGELRTRRALAALFRNVQPDIVHCFTVKPVVHGGAAGRAAGVPAVAHTITGLGHAFLRPGPSGTALRTILGMLYRRAFQHPNCCTIFQNPDDRNLFLRKGWLRAEQTRLVRGSGIDPASIPALPFPKGEPVAILPARMLWDKGVGEFVQAARLLRAQGVPLRMALVGEADLGNPAAVPASQLEAWEKEGIVERWGWQSDVKAFLARSHIVCLPSYREGIPRALLEGGLAGRPLVTTDVAGCREVVRDGQEGLLVPPRDPEALAAAIGSLAGDSGLRKRMGAQARLHVETHFSSEQVVREVLEVYAQLLATIGRTPPHESRD